MCDRCGLAGWTGIIRPVRDRSTSKFAGVASTITQPIIIPRSEHGISDTDISGGTLKVLQTLTDAGHSAYLVGGGVRDLLLGLKPKDFDIATGATPDTVRGLFRSCRLIGRRFRLAHVRMGREVIEGRDLPRGLR